MWKLKYHLPIWPKQPFESDSSIGLPPKITSPYYLSISTESTEARKRGMEIWCTSSSTPGQGRQHAVGILSISVEINLEICVRTHVVCKIVPYSTMFSLSIHIVTMEPSRKGHSVVLQVFRIAQRDSSVPRPSLLLV